MKILSRLMRPWAPVEPGDAHAIIATDSDVVLMALVTPAPNVYVLAEPSRQMQHARAKLLTADARGPGPGPGSSGQQARAARARGLPMTRGFTCFSVNALHRLWLQRYPFLRGATTEVRSPNHILNNTLYLMLTMTGLHILPYSYLCSWSQA